MRNQILLLVSLIASFAYSQEIITENKHIDKANNYYTSGDYLNAAKTYYKAYTLHKNSKKHLYYAASSAVRGKEYKLALDYYLQLKNLNYDGIENEYLATNKKTKKEEVFDLKVRDSLVRIGEYSKPKQRKSLSKMPEILKNIALIYIELGEHKEALTTLQYAIKESPKDLELVKAEANIYYVLDDISKFESKLKWLVKKDKRNDDFIYNLGVISADQGNVKLAEKYYKKAIKINPNNTVAHINLSALILAKELPLIEVMNNLGISEKENKRYDKMLKERNAIHMTALPYLEKALKLSPDNNEVYNTLLNVYESLGLKNKIKILKETSKL